MQSDRVKKTDLDQIEQNWQTDSVSFIQTECARLIYHSQGLENSIIWTIDHIVKIVPGL